MRGSVTKQMTSLFDDREVLGMRGSEKIAIIVKIQALFRGALARKRIKQRYGFQATGMFRMN